jgi:hypothetical protein
MDGAKGIHQMANYKDAAGQRKVKECLRLMFGSRFLIHEYHSQDEFGLPTVRIWVH